MRRHNPCLSRVRHSFVPWQHELLEIEVFDFEFPFEFASKRDIGQCIGPSHSSRKTARSAASGFSRCSYTPGPMVEHPTHCGMRTDGLGNLQVGSTRFGDVYPTPTRARSHASWVRKIKSTSHPLALDCCCVHMCEPVPPCR